MNHRLRTSSSRFATTLVRIRGRGIGRAREDQKTSSERTGLIAPRRLVARDPRASAPGVCPVFCFREALVAFLGTASIHASADPWPSGVRSSVNVSCDSQLLKASIWLCGFLPGWYVDNDRSACFFPLATASLRPERVLQASASSSSVALDTQSGELSELLGYSPHSLQTPEKRQCLGLI